MTLLLFRPQVRLVAGELLTVAWAAQSAMSHGNESLLRIHPSGYHTRSIAVLIVYALLSLLSAEVFAQQSQPTTLEAENAELRRRVKTLEERLEKVEVELRKNAPARGSEEGKVTHETKPTPEKPPIKPSVGQGDPQSKSNGLLDFFKKTEVSGFIDTYYAYNFNQPRSRINTLRFFDTRHNQFAFNVAGITFERKPDVENSRFGFMLDLNFGPAADILSSFEPGRIETYKNIHQAYGSYLAPLGSGLQFDVGKFISWNGAEWDEAKSNWNYSRGLLYTYAQPGYHSGVQASYDFNDKVSLLGAIVNGWDNVEENNSGKTFALSLTLTPTSKFSLIQSYTTGPEQPNDRRHYRHLFDTIATYNITRRLSIMGNYDYGFDKLTAGNKVRWQGIGAYLRYAFTDRFALSPRFEWYGDYDGFTTGTAQKLKEATLTGEYKLGGNLLTRLELRRDWSDKFVFEKNEPGKLSRSQATLIGGFIWSFSTRESESVVQSSSIPKTPPVISSNFVSSNQKILITKKEEKQSNQISSTLKPHLNSPQNVIQVSTITPTDSLPPSNTANVTGSLQR